MNYYAPLRPHLARLNLATLGMALLLFLLPWTTIECGGREVATQSGLQTIYGGASVGDDFKEMERRKADDESDESEGMGFGLLALVALLLVLAGTAVAAWTAFGRPTTAASPGNGWVAIDVSPGLLAAAALAVLLLSTAIGFPVDREVREARREMNAGGGDGGTEADRQIGRAVGMAMQIDSERTGWFYAELAVLLVPALLYLVGRVPALQSLPSAPPPASPPPPT